MQSYTTNFYTINGHLTQFQGLLGNLSWHFNRLILICRNIKDFYSMKSKNFNADVLRQIKERLVKVENKQRRFSNESYLEYQFYNTDHIHAELMQNLISLASTDQIKTNILNNLVENHNKYFSCLLAYCQQIEQVIEESDLFSFSHKGFVSQSALLAFFLAKRTGAKVSLAASDDSLLRMGHLIAGEAEEDKLSFTKSALQKEDIALHSLGEWRKGGLMAAENETLIVDVFGLSPIEYSPLLLRSAGQWKGKVFIYHSHLQDGEVADLLGKAGRTALPLRLWGDHPTEAQLEKDESKLLQSLIDFLAEDRAHPEKQDVVIFFPVETHPKRFAARLAEQLSKAGLRDHVAVVTKPHQPQLRSKNNIFIVEGTQQLLTWNYDYSNVLYVVDYGRQIKFTYDYSYDTFVRSVRQSSQFQKARRMSLVGVSRIGRYACLKNKMSNVNSYIEEAKELSIYILKMIDYGTFKHVDITNPRISACLSTLNALQIIKKCEQGYEVTDERLIQAAKNGISATQSQLIYGIIDDSTTSEGERRRLANLMIMALIVTHNENNLRQAKQEVEAKAHIKPNGIWRKTGYIDSCLEILTKCELIDSRKSNPNSKSENFRRKTSKFNEYEYDVFGSLFEIEEKRRKTFDEMEIPDLVRQYTVNDDLLNILREQVDDYRSVFDVEPMNINFEKEDIIKVNSLYQGHRKRAAAIYSGSRRNGYFLAGLQTGVFPDKTSLLSQLNERPDFITVFRLSQSEGRKEILMGNSYTAETYIEVFGELPARRGESISEVELEFHGISSTTFEKLWKNNGAEIVKFENENDCFVSPNQEMALIIIHCIKEHAEKVKERFEIVLTKIREKLSVSNKLVHYLGKTNLILGAGGAIKEVVKADFINKCLLGNLHLQVTKQDLQELFDEIVPVKDVVVLDPEPGKFYKSAIVHFHSQRDYYTFYNCFYELTYLERTLDVKPLKDELANVVKAQQCIEFKWYVWKSHRKALVKFAKQEGAKKAAEAFNANPQLDGIKVKITLDELKNSLIIEQLSSTTDEIYIEEALKNYGAILDVQILKTPLKEISGEDIFLQNLIRAVNFQNMANANFKMEPIERKKNGLRICKVNIPNLDFMNMVANELNKTIGKLGQGRLYAQTWFEMPILVPYGSMSIYQELLEEVMQGFPEHPHVDSFIAQDNRKTYIVLKSRMKQSLDFVHQKFANSILGVPMYLSDYEKSIILTDIGLANILDLEEKYHCKLIVNIQAKVLNLLVRAEKAKQIKEEIRARVDDHFFYRVCLNSKTFKYFCSHPEKLSEIKSNYALTLVELEIESKALLLESSALNVQKAFNYLMHFIQSLTVPEQQMINADVCGICCQEPHRPYRLQNCSHKFCRDCIMQYINSALGDASLFPLKCPHCFKEMVIDDLEVLLQPAQWVKVQTIAVNQYVTHRADVMTFCFTPGCKQINHIKSDSIECDVCLATFCLACKLRYHPGLTCEQAKHGGDELFKKFMKDNGIRQCPNKACKIPVERIDGCYRVTCSRCNKSMCFKCEPDKMIAYDDYNLCYQHLNDVHGGYW